MTRLLEAGSAALLAALAACGGSSAPVEPKPAVQLAKQGGDGQTGPAGTDLPVPLRVKLTENGAPAAGRSVTWTVTAGGASVTNATTTDAQGVATATVRLGAAAAGSIRASADTAAAVFTVTAVAASANPVLVGEVDIPPVYGIHDTFVRSGIAFVCAWNTGVIIYDVGDGRAGGSPSHPVEISRLATSEVGVAGGPQVHNAWWFHNPVTAEQRYLFVGQEGAGTIGVDSHGDLHVVDVSDLAAPREVASLRIAGAGVHNFWMDEAKQILYAAFYNGGVVALDVSGTLSGDLTSRIVARRAPGGPDNTFVWGVMLANGALWASDIVSGFWKLDPVTLGTLGGGNNVPERWGSDLWVSGSYAYTGTWGGTSRNGVTGNAIKIWRIDGAGPVLADSVIVPDVRTISDLEVTDDGQRLVVTTERLTAQGLQIFDLSNPAKPVLAGSVVVSTGLHTGTLARIAGRLYVFAARNPNGPKLQIYDITR